MSHYYARSKQLFLLTTTILAVLFLAACPKPDVRPPVITESGAFITVRTEPTIKAAQIKALVCHDLPIRSTMGLSPTYEFTAHLERVQGDNCAVATFKCKGATSPGPEVTICAGDAPKDTGCKTDNGKPIFITVESVFH